MPGINLHFTRKRKQFPADACYQSIKIAAGQVRAANAFAEQYIAAYYELLRFAIKTNMAGRVAWRKQDFKFIATQPDNVLFRYVTYITGVMINRKVVVHAGNGRKIQNPFSLG